MSRYLIRRFVFAIVTLLLLSMVVFGMAKYAPTDTLVNAGQGPDEPANYRQQIAKATAQAAKLHLNLPVFYFSLTTADRPDTLDRIFPYNRREGLVRLLNQSGNWPNVQRYEDALLAADDAVWHDTAAQAKPLRAMLIDLRGTRQLATADALAESARQLGTQTASREALETLAGAAHVLRTDLQPENQWRPALHWDREKNQYHLWLSGFLRGDLGQSISSGHPVWETLRFSLLTTLLVNGLSFFLAFRIAIPLGIAMARRRGRFDWFSRWLLLLLYAMPGFWLGGLLLLVFATPHTGLHLIDGIDLGAYNPTDGPYLLWVGQNADKFIMPVMTLTLHTLALITLQLRGGVREVMTQDFIRTARAKGISESLVYRRHAFRNSVIPLITIFAGVFPALFAGSIVVEYLFNFPGMGMKTYEAYLYEDYSLLFAILMLGAVMTVVGNFLGDVLYVWADPRVRYDHQ
ncbi:MAG: ABC transporter permease subunit [Saprospiraceae bacterium]